MEDYNNVLLRGHMTRRNSLLFLACLGLLLSVFSHGAIPASERAALIALYNATNGDNWSNNHGRKWLMHILVIPIIQKQVGVI